MCSQQFWKMTLPIDVRDAVEQVSNAIANFLDYIDRIYSDASLSFNIHKSLLHKIIMGVLNPVFSGPPPLPPFPLPLQKETEMLAQNTLMKGNWQRLNEYQVKLEEEYNTGKDNPTKNNCQATTDNGQDPISPKSALLQQDFDRELEGLQYDKDDEEGEQKEQKKKVTRKKKRKSIYSLK